MNPPGSLLPAQLVLYNRLSPENQSAINAKYDTIQELNNFQVNDELRNEVRQSVGGNMIPDDGTIDIAINQAKTEIIAENNTDITLILNGNPPELRRTVGGGERGLLINKAVDVLRNIPPPVVGGKLRKSSNKKRPTIRRRRSSKARKSRKSRSTRRR